jgi:hypothetical protein
MEQLMPYSEVISDRQLPRRPVPLERPHNYTWNTNYHRAALAFPRGDCHSLAELLFFGLTLAEKHTMCRVEL